MKFATLSVFFIMFLFPDTVTMQGKQAGPCPNCPPKDCVYCFVDPCTVTTCDLGPGIKLKCKKATPHQPTKVPVSCRADYCGGCHAKFYHGNLEVTDFCQRVNKP